MERYLPPSSTFSICIADTSESKLTRKSGGPIIVLNFDVYYREMLTEQLTSHYKWNMHVLSLLIMNIGTCLIYLFHYVKQNAKIEL